MSSGNPARTRSKRVASVELPPGLVPRTLRFLRRGDVLLRLLLCLIAAVAMCIITKAWSPPLGYRTSDIPSHAIVSRTDFERPNPDATKLEQQEERKRAAAHVVNIYSNDPTALEQLRYDLKDRVFQIIRAASTDEIDEAIWQEFLGKSTASLASTAETSDQESDTTTDAAKQELLESFRQGLADDAELEKFDKSIHRVLSDHERLGLLEKLDHDLGSSKEIYIQPDRTDLIIRADGTELFVAPTGVENSLEPVPVEDVRIAEIGGRLKEELAAYLPDEIEDFVFRWIHQQLPETLTWNQKDSERAAILAAEAAADAIEPVTDKFFAGELLPEISLDVPLDDKSMGLLSLEHAAFVAERDAASVFWRGIANFGMYVAIYMLCGFYIAHREPRLLQDIRRFSTLLIFFSVVVALGQLSILLEWRAEIVPLLLLAIIMTIAYRQDLALLLTASIGMVVVLTSGRGLTEYVIYVATAAAAIQSSVHIRSRTKLIYVGLYAGAVGSLTTVGVSVVAGCPFGATLLAHSALYGFFAFLAGVLMTGLLPFIEALFDVQTEISLLELGDAAHPLLQELVRRAPGTYNHSINVASIAEAAADAVGANGLLVRVGAYFHDIGKMLKPGYFAENQGEGDNRHESLVPAMSTLVIIAHMKDGADLARQHHLPQSIIDFIEQHHGTTLVEFFYDQAKGQSKGDPNGEDVDENTFRYPGPKPQSKEAGVMMLADVVESASRALVDPTPARIESLVEEMAMNHLLDGQFDECGLTLAELRSIELSLSKSLTAVFHGRVKYPNQQSA